MGKAILVECRLLMVTFVSPTQLKSCLIYESGWVQSVTETRIESSEGNGVELEAVGGIT